MTHKRTFAGLIAAAVAAGVVAPAAVAAPVAAGTPGTGPVETITLLTGDRVTLGGPKGVEVAPGPGREHISFSARARAAVG